MNEWIKVCPLEEIPRLGSRVVHSGKGEIAVFRNNLDEVFALQFSLGRFPGRNRYFLFRGILRPVQPSVYIGKNGSIRLERLQIDHVRHFRKTDE